MWTKIDAPRRYPLYMQNFHVTDSLHSCIKKMCTSSFAIQGCQILTFYQSQWHLTDIHGVLWHLGTKHLSYAIVRRGCHSKFLLNCFNPNRIIFLNWTKSYLCLNLNSEARKIRPHTRFQRGHEPPLQWQTCSLMVDGIKNGCSQREVSHRFWTLHFHASALVIWLLPCCFILSQNLISVVGWNADL